MKRRAAVPALGPRHRPAARRAGAGLAAAAVAGVLAVPALGGCAAGIVAAQAVPVVITSVASNTADRHSPFITYGPDTRPTPADTQSDEAMDALVMHIRRAECGDAPSQYWLASALGNGFNEKPDRVEIYKWYRLAQMGGVEPAAGGLTEVASGMSRSEIATAQARALAWTPRREGCPDES